VKAAVMPGFSELIIIINPAKEVTREGLLTIIMPWLYAPWPEARERGVIEIEVAGNTLKALLAELSHRYKQANVDFDPIVQETNQLDFDYDVFVNGKNYLSLPAGLDTMLGDGDEVKVKMLWRWDG
jgi:molybdopterin converting factor small subunit